MKKETTYSCDHCSEIFDNENNCLAHEDDCGKVHIFECDKCGKVVEYTIGSNKNDPWLEFAQNECWNIDLGRPGYGSKLDGCEVNFNLCDDCLYDFIDSFRVEGKVKIHNSGSNTYGSNEDWIRIEKGEMSDEEMEEMGLISPRQEKAYEERFPICDKVKIYKYDDGSCGSCCGINCAFGDWDEKNIKTGLQIYSDCYECGYFKERADNEEVEIVFRESDITFK